MRLTFGLLKDASKSSTHVPYEQLKAAISIVGKNSKFLTKLRSEYIDEELIKKKASWNKMEMRYNAARTQFMTPQLLNAHNADVNFHILELLREITPSDLYSLDYTNVHASYRHITRYINVVLEDLPQMPAVLTTELFRDYIRKLTLKKYLLKGASNPNTGVVVPLIKGLFRSENGFMKSLRDVESYNMAILYFLKNNDLDYARTLLNQMKQDFIQPNTVTYNSFLYNLCLPKDAFTVDPIVTAQRILTWMKTGNLKLDLATWYLIFRITKEDVLFNKDLTKLYHEFRLPNTSQFITISIQNNFDNLSVSEVLELLNSLKDPKYTELVHIVLAKLLKERKINEAWSFLQQKIAIGFKPNAETLQRFLETFTNMELIQLSLGAFYTFIQRYNIKPTPSTFYSLFLVTTKTGFHRNWREMARIIYHEMVHFQNGSDRNKAGYWITRLQLRAVTDKKADCKKIDFKVPLNNKELDLLQQIKEGLLWGDKIVVNPGQGKQTPYFELCKLVGVRFKAHKGYGALKTTDEDRSLRTEYRLKVRSQNIKRSLVHRAKIVVKGPLNHLVDELRTRNIVNDGSDLADFGLSASSEKKPRGQFKSDEHLQKHEVEERQMPNEDKPVDSQKQNVNAEFTIPWSIAEKLKA